MRFKRRTINTKLENGNLETRLVVVEPEGFIVWLVEDTVDETVGGLGLQFAGR